MKICVFGAGAIGGWLAVRLAAAGNEVSVVARGEHLAAIAKRGLMLISGDEQICQRVTASEDPKDLGWQDVVIVALKATSLEGLATAMRPLLDEHTSVVFLQNGIPWWYATGLGPKAPKTPDLSFLDVDGKLSTLAGRTIGGVVRTMVEVTQPGVVTNRTPALDSLVVADPTDQPTSRVLALRTVLGAAALPSPPTESIRTVLWNKLLANITGSVMCMLTGFTNRQMHEDPRFVHVLETLRRETQAIGAHYGCPIASLPPVPQRILSAHKPSILQDYEKGRAMELDAIVVAPLTFARMAQIPTPSLDLMASLAVQKAMAAGLYTPRGPLPF